MVCNGRGPVLGRLVFGFIVLALGVIFTLDSLNLIESRNILRYWPVILIAIGLAKLVQPRGGRIFGLILAAVGVLFLLKTFDALPWDVWDFWPVILILLGFSIITQAFGHHPRRGRRHRVVGWRVSESGAGGGGYRVHAGGGTAESGVGGAGFHVHMEGGAEPVIDQDSYVDISNTMSGSERIVATQDFQGGRISATMAGIALDLRQASMKVSEATLDVRTLFGGIELRIPESWKVVLNVNTTLGGVSDTTRKPMDEGAKRLIVTGQVTLGGLEIHN